MAKVFKNYGTEQVGPEDCILPLLKCVELLEIDQYSETEPRPKFGEKSTWPFTARYVVVVEDPEAQEHGFKPGPYESPLEPREAEDRLDRYLGRERK